MNRLNKLLLSFVLPFFCLLMSVSNADFSSTPLQISSQSWEVVNNSLATPLIGITSTNEEFYNACVSFAKYPDNPTYQSAFYSLVNSLDANGYGIIFGYQPNAVNSKGVNVFVFDKSTSIGFCAAYDLNDSNKASDILFTDCTEGYCFNGKVYSVSGIFDSYYLVSMGPESEDNSNIYSDNPYVYCSKDIKELYQSGGICWDGASYYYQTPSSGEDTPSLPSNAEIAQAVQAFYNSDYYKNNKDFKEFFVLYNSLKGIYSFIGHNSVGEIANHFEYGSTLSQIIYSDDYPSNTYGLSYWKFNLETLGSQISNFFNNYYWLYSSYDNGESITYDGKGYVTDLVEVEFDSRYSTIVYSSTNYLCRVYDYENEEETTNDATIPGNQYTYDETLDPTTNEYNPIKDYVPTDPTQSVLGDVDFDEINKVFEENKDILNIENASWLFSANNQLINYFIGFLSFLIVLIIISRLLGG